MFSCPALLPNNVMMTMIRWGWWYVHDDADDWNGDIDVPPKQNIAGQLIVGMRGRLLSTKVKHRTRGRQLTRSGPDQSGRKKDLHWFKIQASVLNLIVAKQIHVITSGAGLQNSKTSVDWASSMRKMTWLLTSMKTRMTRWLEINNPAFKVSCWSITS